MQTILGAGGAIGLDLAVELTKFTDLVRLVGRNPKHVVGDEELFTADLLNQKQVNEALEGSEIAYLVAGLPYKTAVWQQDWQRVMNNVIEACIRNKCKLVFFDNVYMYGKVDGAMTEETPINPCSKKGEVRAHIAEMLMSTADTGEIDALIARSADFYGAKAINTASFIMILDKFKNGKKASWIINDKVIHSATFTPDAAKATAILGNTADAYNQVWHMPTDPEPISGKQFVEYAAEAFGVEARYNVMSMWMMKMVGWFNSDVKEILEMMYQQEFDYYFDSSKFNDRFFKPTKYRDGLKICAQEMLKK